MNTLTIHTADQDQETVIKLFLDALHVEYKLNEEKSVGEAAYPMSSSAMQERLNNAAVTEKHGEEIKISLSDMFSDVSI